MSGLLTRVVHPLGGRTTEGSAVYSASGFAYDYAIGGLPFLGNPNREHPFIRKTAPYRKDQVDQTTIPGEQSMVYWWLRSQISFHGGSGIKFEEPALDTSVLYSDPLSAASIPTRFQDGEGIDPWTTPGQVSLLPGTTQKAATAGTGLLIEGAVDGTTDIWLQADAATLKRCVEGSTASVTWGGAGTIVALTQDGTNYYAADSTGIYRGTLAGGVGTKIWNTGSSSVVIKWAKDRLIAAVGASLYELVSGGPALPTALFTPQVAGFAWACIEEGPDCIFFAGNLGSQSKIYASTLSADTGAVPILGTPVEVASLPVGELIYSLKLVMGSYLAIGTNKGVRIAEVGKGGQISYGPIIYSAPSGQPVRSLTTFDRFVYAAHSNGMADGTSGLVCIDLGYQTQYARFAYAKHLRAHVAGVIRSVTLFGTSGRLIFAVDGSGSYLQNTSAQALESSGYLQTGNIRFHTTEKKLFKYVTAHLAPLNYGTVAISLTDSNGGVTSLVTLGSTTEVGEVAIPSSVGPVEWVNLTFTISRDGVTTNQGPTFYGYQVKALPAQKNQRLIQVPILLFDKETDRFGAKIGYEGYAWARLTALEAIEELRDQVTFQDLTRNPQEARLVVIDDITFQQTDPPTNYDGFGGVAVVTLRTVT